MNIQCFRPKALEEALSALDAFGSELLIVNGATDVMPKLHDGVLHPDKVLFLYGLGMDTVTYTDTEVRIGACVTQNAILQEPRMEEALPLLCEAVRHMSGVSVRNAATISGNLCNASPASDSAPALLALDATVIARSARGTREIPLSSFFTGPGRNCLSGKELLTEIRVPYQRGQGRFFKIGQRKAEAISVVNGASRMTLDGAGRCKTVRIAFGSVGPTPCRAPHGEAVLLGKQPTPALCREAASAAMQDISPIDDIRSSAWYRSRVAENMTARCLLALAGWGEAEEQEGIR